MRIAGGGYTPESEPFTCAGLYHELGLTQLPHMGTDAAGADVELLVEEGSEGAVVRARHLIDAYCGSGLFALASAGRFEACAGVETCESAVRSARANAKANGIGNCGFVAASAEEIFGRLPAAFAGREAAVVMDPPRKGADLSFLRQLLRFAPRRVVYVSCGADTLARDLRLLVERYDARVPPDGLVHGELRGGRSIEIAGASGAIDRGAADRSS